jgi:hypothetical protein
MRLWMGGEIQGDVGDAHREVRNQLEAKVNSALAERDYGDGLVEWAFIAMIFGDIDPGYKEVTRYSRKKKEYESRLRINHAKFKAAEFGGRMALLCEALLRSLDGLESLKVKNIDVPGLRKDFLQVISACGWSAKTAT